MQTLITQRIPFTNALLKTFVPESLIPRIKALVPGVPFTKWEVLHYFNASNGSRIFRIFVNKEQVFERVFHLDGGKHVLAVINRNFEREVNYKETMALGTLVTVLKDEFTAQLKKEQDIVDDWFPNYEIKAMSSKLPATEDTKLQPIAL